MKQTRYFVTFRYLRNSLLAVLAVLAATVPLYLIGRAVLGEAVIALVYLVPVTWSAYRWGQLPGIVAALAAALAFDFFFTMPYFTFVVDRLEDWLILVFFLGVAILVVEWIQTSLTKARDAVFMYEMSAAICGQRTPEAVAYAVGRQIQQLFQALLVNVVFRPDKNLPGIVISVPAEVAANGRPDRVLPIVNSWGLVGEIQIWRGLYSELPAHDGRLFQNFAQQTARAFERTYQFEADSHLKATPTEASAQK